MKSQAIIMRPSVTSLYLWMMAAMMSVPPVLPLNVESDVPGGVQQMLESLLKVLNDAEGIDLTPLKKAVEEA